MGSMKKDLPPPSPTGCEYYLFSRSESTSETILYNKRLLPLYPALTPGIETRILYALEDSKITAIEELLAERNSRTVEDGQWVVVGLRVVGEVFGVAIRFFRYGAVLNEEEICLKRKVTSDGPPEELARAESGLDEDEETEVGDADTGDLPGDFEHRTVGNPSTVATGNKKRQQHKETASTGESAATGEGVLTQDESGPTGTERANPSSRKYTETSKGGRDTSAGVSPRNRPYRGTAPENVTPKKHKDEAEREIESRSIEILIDSREFLNLKKRVETYISTDRWSEADMLLSQMFEMYTTTLSTLEQEKLRVMHKQADTYMSLRQFDEAIAIFTPTLEGRKKLFGESNEDTLKTMYKLGLCYQIQGRDEEAEVVYKHCLDGMIEVYGEDDERTLRTMDKLADIYEVLLKHEEADELYNRLAVLS